MKRAAMALSVLALISLCRGAEPAWVDAMKQVHAKFKGTPGTFAHFGDSITITMAFWCGLEGGGKNMNAETKAAHELVKGYMAKECWRGWKGDEYGNTGMMTIRWAHENVDKWLQKLNPEAALIMFGTNDLTQLKEDEYEQKTREVVKKCLDNGTVVILSTIPPRHGLLDKAKKFAEIVQKVGADMKIPVCDFFGEILKRRPDDWDGVLEKFKDRQGYNVLTLVAGDGVHPSNPNEFADNYSEEALKNNGFGLRNWVVLMSYAEVIQKAFKAAK